MAEDKEIRRIINGAFFGAIYSIVLVQPLILMTNNNVNSISNDNFAYLIKIILYPLIIIIGYVIINRSITWKYPKNTTGLGIKSLLTHKIEVVDILLTIVFILTAVIMCYFNILNRIDAFMWISGVGTILTLQLHSIPKLLDETN